MYQFVAPRAGSLFCNTLPVNYVPDGVQQQHIKSGVYTNYNIYLYIYLNMYAHLHLRTKLRVYPVPACQHTKLQSKDSIFLDIHIFICRKKKCGKKNQPFTLTCQNSSLPIVAAENITDNSEQNVKDKTYWLVVHCFKCLWCHKPLKGRAVFSDSGLAGGTSGNCCRAPCWEDRASTARRHRIRRAGSITVTI